MMLLYFIYVMGMAGALLGAWEYVKDENVPIYLKIAFAVTTSIIYPGLLVYWRVSDHDK